MIPDSTSIPFYLKALIIVSCLIPLARLFWLFYQAGLTQWKLAIPVAIILVFYFMLSWLHINDFFSDLSSFPPKVLITIVFPLLALFVLAFSPFTGGIIKKLPLLSLVELQSFRFLAEAFIALMVYEGLMPSIMTIEGRNIDIIVPFSVFLISPLVRANWLSMAARRNLLIFWNFSGIVILSNTVATAVLAMPTPAQKFMTQPPLLVPIIFPVFLLPAFLVPLAFFLHALSLRQLISDYWAGKLEYPGR